MKFNATQLAQLKEFVKILKAHPETLEEDDLSFFREYLASLGAKVTERIFEEEEEEPEPTKVPEPEQEPEPELEEEEEKEEDIVEPVDPDVIEPETDAAQPTGDLDATPSEEGLEKAQELRGEASQLISQGELQQAIDVLTEAITKHNGSAAPLYNSRAQCFLRLKKPVSAIRDADTAIKINPDSAPPYRVRGRAKALLGQWAGAVADLKAANQRDYDPEVYELLKTLTKKADDAAARQKKRDEIRHKRENKHKNAGGAKKPAGGAGAGGIPNWLPQDMLGKLMQDPDVLAAMQDPAVLPILTEIMKDPSAALKYKDHPKISKLAQKFGNFIPTQQ